jgi:DNA-binding CsgD family transcriptional regulator
MVRDRPIPGQDDRNKRESGAAVRTEIAASWARSARCGVRRDRLDVTCDRETETGEVGRAGGSVLDRLADDFDGIAMSVILADDQARVIDWRVGTAGLAAVLDGLGLAIGWSWGEDRVGTNAIGTAIVVERPMCVGGREHYADPLTVLACAAAPIEYPRAGRLVGVVGIVCAAEQSDALMSPLARHAARDVEERLVVHSSTAQHTLIDRAPSHGRTSTAARRRANRYRYGWESLTATELRVAEAVADGLTNAEAARWLLVSPYTVDYHLRQIFRKLDIGSRVQLAALVTTALSPAPGASPLTRGLAPAGCWRSHRSHGRRR